MNYKQIEASREARLWIGQVIVPAATLALGIFAANPDLRFKTKQKIEDVKYAVKSKFNKTEA